MYKKITHLCLAYECSFYLNNKLNRSIQYKLLYTILNDVEVYEEPVSRTKKFPLCSVEFETGEEKIIEYESF